MNSKSKLGRILLTGASLAAMGAFSPAFAQDDEPTEEIVVTATGRTAAIQDVPIAVTALSGETLEDAGVENLLDLEQMAPSLRIGAGQSTSAGTIARIRGLGTGGDNPGFESAVGFFIDGVYRARAGIAVGDLPELDRIEVLRGPQGTLYGRNTSSGAVSVFTAGPDFRQGMWLEAGAGDLNYGRAAAGGNIALSDNFALRFDGIIRARDGYLTDFTTGRDFNTQDRYLLRGQALWDITPEASLRVIADFAETNENCCAATMLRYSGAQSILNGAYLALAGGYAPFLPSFSGVSLPNTAGVVTSPEDRYVTVTPGRDYLEQVEDGGISGQLDWDIGDLHLTSITAYRSWDALRNQDIDFGTMDLFNREGLEIGIDNFTQEIRLQGERGNVDWLIGAFFSNEELDTTDRIRLGARGPDYANATVFARTAGLGFPSELYDGTTAAQDDAIFGDNDGILNEAGVDNDPMRSILGLVDGSPAPGGPLDQVYIARNLPGQGQNADNWTQEARDIALFTHNEISFTPETVLTVGLRYSHSQKEVEAHLDATSTSCASMQAIEGLYGVFSGVNTAANGAPSVAQATAAGIRSLFALACAPQFNTAVNGTWSGDREENEWSGTLSLRHHFSEDLMGYVSYARGYKAGGFNVDRSAFTGLFPGMTVAQAQTAVNVNQIAFEPEFTDAYEIGMRSTLFGGSTFFNVTAFYQQLHDYQLNAFNGTAFITRNIPEAISQGVEIDLLTRPIDGLTLQVGANYTDAYNDSTVAFVANSPGDTVVAGTPLVQAPEISLTGSISYEMPIGSSLLAGIYFDVRHDSEYRTQALNRDPSGISDMDSSTTVNGRLSLGNVGENWSVELWGRNLTDEFIYGGFAAPLQGSGTDNTIGAFTNEPQTYGVTVRARY
jgi:iron complex outermembrane receptor protein